MRGALYGTGTVGKEKETAQEFLQRNLDVVLLVLAVIIAVFAGLLVRALQAEQKEKEAREITKKQAEEVSAMNVMLQERMDMIQSLSKLFFSVHYIDLETGTFEELSTKKNIR